MTESSNRHVALATDRQYLPWSATAVLSCLRAVDRDVVVVHLLHEGDLTDTDTARLRGMVEAEGGELVVHVIDARRVADLPSKGPALGRRTSWLRVVLPGLLPDVERIVYLDADTLIIESLEPLWHEPLDGAALAAVANVVEPAMRPHVQQLGLDPRRYFNAGVLVMDLAHMREHRAEDELRRYVHGRSDQLAWFDQDVLNVVFADRWRPLHPRWNAQNSLWAPSWVPWADEVFGPEVRQQAVNNPSILHFEGPSLAKPWHYLSQHPYRFRYRAILAATPWRDQLLEGRTLANRVIGRLPPQSQLPAFARLARASARVRRVRRRLGI